jgi:Glycosyl transferases group 1
MRFHFTEEDHPTQVRGRDIRAALVMARHVVTRGPPGAPAPPGTDVWMFGLGVAGLPPLGASLVEGLMSTHAELVLFQLCDAASLSFERLPGELLGRTRLFLRNHWPSDDAGMASTVRERLGLMPPMLRPMAPRRGPALRARSIGASFFGTRTGDANLPNGRNAREETVRLMRASGLPFRGGLLTHDDARYLTDPALVVPRLTRRAHDRLLLDTRICIAPWGNHPLSYRLFEGLALRCLVVAQSLRSVRFLDGGLTAGRHYVEVREDLGDLAEVVGHYLAHPVEAQRIADEGHALFRRCFAARGRLVSRWVFEASVSSWGEVYRPAEACGPGAVARSLAARLWPRRF